MDKSKKLSRSRFIYALAAAVITVIKEIPELCGFDSTYIGEQGLKNFFLTNLCSSLSVLLLILALGFGSGFLIKRSIRDINLYKILLNATAEFNHPDKEDDITEFKTGIRVSILKIILAAVIALPGVILIAEGSVFKDIGICIECVQDMQSGDYDTFTVTDLLCLVTHAEGRYDSENSGTGALFSSPIGTKDEVYIKRIRSVEKEFDVKVYKNTGLIMEFVTDSNINMEDGYSYMYKIAIKEDSPFGIRPYIVRSNVEKKPYGLAWYCFKSGESADVKKSLYFIEAKDSEKEVAVPECDEICLYGTVDGKRQIVSNIIYINNEEEG